jgi:hypothetical protein
MDLGKEIALSNVYGPYVDSIEYWDKFFHMGCLHIRLVVVRGDLNFTLGASQVWGPVTQVDCFIKTLEEVGLLNVEPAKLSPTSRNNLISP